MMNKRFTYVSFLLFLVLLISTFNMAAGQVQKGTLGGKVVGEETYNCAGKRFGLVGASNTVDTNPDGSSIPLSWRNVKIIQDLCPGAAVFLHAKGGTWPGAQVSLVQAVLQNDDLDYVILDPSANGQQDSSGITPETYKEAALNLAKMVKDKNQNIKVIMLTNTPTKGNPTDYGSSNTIQRVKAFNADLLNTRLGKPELIDYAVDTYSATEDPLGSDSCGNYCGSDKLHFGETGRKRVMKAVMDTVFGAPTSATVVTNTAVSPSSSTAAENCLNPLRCDEIDAVWMKIVVWVNSARKGQIFDTIKGSFRSYQEVRPTVVITPGVGDIDGLKSASPDQIKQYIKQNLGEDYIEDIDYLTRILAQERGCADEWKQERGAIAQVVINRVHSTQWGNTVKDVVASNSWNANFASIIPAQSGLEDSSKNGCTISAIKFMMCTGEEDLGAKKIGGRDGFVHRQTQVAQGREVPPWNYVNPIQVQETGNVATFSGKDITPKDCSLRRYKSGVPEGVSSVASGISNAVLSVTSIFGGNCPPEMASINNKYCIDKWEDSIYDKNNPSAQASLFYPAKTSQADLFYNYWKNGWKGNQPPNSNYAQMPSQGAETSNGFVPLAKSQPNVIPNMYVSKEIAEQACASAGKRLCTEDEWVRACKGPSITQYPYGNDYVAGKCNTNQAGKYPPSIVGWDKVMPANQFDPSDPRNGKAAVDIGGVKETGSFSECSNAHGVYDMVGNLAEVVSTPSSSGNSLFKGSAFMRSGDNLNCNDNIGAHAATYTDYSLGFRCCATLS
ncbi:MAG: SUMF1/EgtB/PvdO family nonheme iron enzyme [Nanoarchaeota archaeon]|nr:SUMF1/EgtB/PvdO family nonheme iron enzyme [Nanoarchaeota archaeon]